MTDKIILQAFNDRLETLDPGVPIRFPGLSFDPPADGLWLETRLFPTETENVSWEADSQNRFRGFYQVSVYFRPGQSASGTQETLYTALDLAKTIIGHYPKGLPVGPVGVIKRPHVSPEIEDGDKVFVPVTIRYLGTE